jgi:hypothetical protein
MAAPVRCPLPWPRARRNAQRTLRHPPSFRRPPPAVRPPCGPARSWLLPVLGMLGLLVPVAAVVVLLAYVRTHGIQFS